MLGVLSWPAFQEIQQLVLLYLELADLIPNW